MLKKSHEAKTYNIFDDSDSHQIISPFEDKKILLPATCAVCGVQGMAYMDPKAAPSPHYCILHNGAIKKEDRKH